MDNNMIPVIVHLSSYTKVEHGEREDCVRLLCHGRLRAASDGYLLRYQEVQRDEETGENNTQDVILSMQKGDTPRVTMTRLGDYGTTMVFVKDRRFEGAYRTPYGELSLALYATQVQCKLEADCGSVHLEYHLDMQGNYSALQCIDISYCAEGSQPC